MDDGVFVEPLLCDRPWVSANVWERGLTKLLGPRSLNVKKKKLEGKFGPASLVWGLDVNASKETFELPLLKRGKAEILLASPFFDPGVLRIPIGEMQSLRGSAEHWSVVCRILHPELGHIDKMMIQVDGFSRPRGTPKAVRQAYIDLLGCCGNIDLLGCCGNSEISDGTSNYVGSILRIIVPSSPATSPEANVQTPERISYLGWIRCNP